MKNFNSLHVVVIGAFALLHQGCTLDEKSTIKGNNPDQSKSIRSPLGVEQEALAGFREKVKAIDDSIRVYFSADTIYLEEHSGEQQKLLVLYRDQDKTPHRLFVWDMASRREELSCCFSNGELLGIKHNNQECFFVKGRMQLWLDEKGHPLPIIDTEEWLDQSNTLIKLAENYLDNFKQ